MSAGDPGFFPRVYEWVRRIPYGKVASYGQLAALAGHPRAPRQVGTAMRLCPDDIPWHRVVRTDGSVTGGDFSQARRAMLEAEGVPFLPDGRVDMAVCQWNGDGAEA
ncbi:MAG: MGMT family protein [Clostridia bacterium]|nr:MGMT family protein [Clostridia bacterium]